MIFKIVFVFGALFFNTVWQQPVHQAKSVYWFDSTIVAGSDQVIENGSNDPLKYQIHDTVANHLKLNAKWTKTFLYTYMRQSKRPVKGYLYGENCMFLFKGQLDLQQNQKKKFKLQT